jgi:hypothetical protein
MGRHIKWITSWQLPNLKKEGSTEALEKMLTIEPMKYYSLCNQTQIHFRDNAKLNGIAIHIDGSSSQRRHTTYLQTEFLHYIWGSKCFPCSNSVTVKNLIRNFVNTNQGWTENERMKEWNTKNNVNESIT